MSERLMLEVPGGAPVELPAAGKLVLGSDPDRADVVLDGQGVDGVHCAIGRLKGGGWALRDLGSRYGTILNGSRIESARLSAGDQILLGSRRLTVLDPSKPQVTPKVEPAPKAKNPKAKITEQQAPKPSTKPGPKPAATPAPSSKSTPVIPGYHLDRPIGKGGMGEVWLATQVSLDRRVAVKSLSAKLSADPSFVERFQAEARAAAALSHPNVVTVHDVGETDGHHYLTMEYMAGGCLEARLASQGPVPWREALRILLDATKGLEFAESRGVVHRDIKPANLMLTADGITKICDLGLAVQVEQEELQAEGRKIFGTPHFIAPELVRGERPDPRSDLYSLGATAYRILSGHTPFEGDNAKDILRRLLSEEPEPLGDVVPGLPTGVSDMVMRLLEKDPGQRTPSAAVLVREIERLLGADGASSAPATASAGSKMPLLIGGLVAVIALVLGVKSMLGGGGDPPEPEPGPSDPNTPLVQGGDQPKPPPEVVQGPDGNGPDSTGPDSTGPKDDESAKVIELEASNAYMRLELQELTDPERVVLLRALAKQFLGTDAGEQARTDANALDASLVSAAGEEARLSRGRAGMMRLLREAAVLDADPPRPGEGLRGLRSVPQQELWEDDAAFLLARLKLRDEILGGALTFAEQTWQQVGQLEQSGDFEGMVEGCRKLVALVDLPDFPDPPPSAVVRLRELAGLARTRKDAAAVLQAAYLTERRGADRSTLAQGLGGARGLSQELGACDFAAAEERLLGLIARLATPEAKARLEPWVADLRLARRAFDGLVKSYQAKEWKRQSVMDPSGSTRDAVGVTSEGLRLSSGTGADLVPWARFGGRLRELHSLFNARLTRDWSAEELATIAALMRLQAVTLAAQEARQLLDPSNNARFSPGEADALDDAFNHARQWSARAGDAEALAREEAAMELLSGAMRAYSEGRWSESVEHLERLLDEHQGSLLVSLLSDGTEWRAPEEPDDEDPGEDSSDG